MKPYSVWILSALLAFSPILHSEEINPKAAKYHSVLVKRPSGGYLFDRFFNAWLDTGTIDSLDRYLQQQAEADDAAVANKLLYGYFLVRQGREDQALSAFEASLETDPDNVEALAELAKARARSLDFGTAVADLDRALELNPKTQLAIELGKLKGRWLSRSGKTELAIKAWQDLISAHPNDDELREDLVDLQLDESLIEDALATQKALIESTRDPYLKITRKLRLGDIHLRSGQREEAKNNYTECLQAAGRDTWLEKEILSQIEHLFRSEDDIAGLKNYYQQLTSHEKGRIALLRRIAMVHAELQEQEQAISVFKQILQATPGDRSNREAFIALLGRLNEDDEAVEQMKALVSSHPDDSELVASLASLENRAGRKDDARDSVLKFLEMSDRSEYAYLRSARMLEQFKDTEAAGDLFDQMVIRFPDSIGAREEKASFLYRADKREQAVAIWKEIAATSSNDNAIRSARMLSSRGYREDAFNILKSRVDEFANDFVFLGRLCEEAIASDHAEDAIPWMETRLSLVTAPGDLAEVLRQCLTILSKSEQTEEYRKSLEEKTRSLDLPSSCLLAEIQERGGYQAMAEKTLARWMEQGEVLALDQRVRQLIARDDWGRAAETMQQIVNLPEGRRSNHIERLVTLYRRSLQNEEALQWIEEWKKVSPGSTSPWLQQAAIENEDGNNDLAINTLRKAVNRFADEEAPRTQLASYYLQADQMADAERIYWNLYDESEDIGAKVRWAGSLASVSERAGKIDRLIEQFEERRRNNRTSIAPLLAIAEIHRKSNNYEGRRQALLEATRLRPEDLILLQQIARIEEEEGDWERAVDTLETALPLDKSNGTKRRIALLHLRYGDEEEGYRKFAELQGGDEMDADAVIGLADAMIARNGWDRGKTFLSQHLERLQDDYRIKYLHAVTLEESGESDFAIEAFLDLLLHQKELPGARNPSTTAGPSSISSYYGDMPPGYSELSNHIRDSYYAYRYRQTLRSGRIQFQNTPGGSGLVSLPNSIEILHRYAVAHLHSLAKTGEQDLEKSLALELVQRGIKNADILLAQPFSDRYSHDHIQYSDLLKRFPDNPGLMAAAVIGQINQVRNRRPISEPQTIIDCCTQLKADYPHLALAGMISTLTTGEEDIYRKVATELDELKQDKAPPGIVTSVAASTLLNFTNDIPSKLKDTLMSSILEWKALQQKEADQKQKNSLSGFSVGDTYAAVLRNSDDLAGFATYLDQQCAEYEAALTRSGNRTQNVSSLGRYLQYTYRGRPMLSALTFPPPEMPGIAPNVLWQFVESRNISFGYNLLPIDPEQAKKVAPTVKNPYLAAILYSAGEDPESAGQLVETIITEAKAKRNKLSLKEALFAAGWHHKNEQWEKAAEILESIRLSPIPRSMRQRVDAAIIASAREKDIGKEEASIDNPEGLAKWGPDAALRLRYGFLNSSQRGELVTALEEFGHDDAAKRLESKGISMTSTQTYSSSSRANVQGITDRINKLVQDKKKDQAQKLLARTVMQITKPFAITGRGNWSYDSVRMVRDIRKKHPNLLNQVNKEALPGADATPKQLLEYAALLEIQGKLKQSVTYYEKAFENLTEAQQSKYLVRYALLKGAIDPEKGAGVLLKVPARELPQISNDANSIRTVINYSESSLSSADVSASLGKMFAHWLKKMPTEQKQGRQDFSFLDRAARYNLISDNGRQIYTPEYRRQFNSSQAVPKERITIHQSICRELIELPQMARHGFSYYACVALGHEDFNDPDLAKLAEQAVLNFSKRPSNLTPAGTSSWNSLSNDYLPLWYPEEYLIWQAHRENKPKDQLLPLIELIRQSKDRVAIKSSDAYFTMLFGEPEDFAKAGQTYLEAETGQNQSYYAGYGKQSTHSTAAKFFEAWKARQSELAKQFDIQEFLLSQAKRAKQQQRNESTIVMAHYVSWLAENQGWPEAERYLYTLTEQWLGVEKHWERFKKEAQRKVQSGSGYYYTGGDFASPTHKQYHGLLSKCSWQPSILFNTIDFAQRHRLDHNQQISQSSMLSYLENNNVVHDTELVNKLASSAPFLAEADRFRAGIFRENRNPAMVTVLQGVANWKDKSKRDQFRNRLKELNTFGANFCLAYLDRRINGANGDDEIPNMLAVYRNDIESMPDQGKDDLATVISKVYPKGVPPEISSPAADEVLSLLGAQKAKSIAEQADQFLEAKDLGDLNIQYESNLINKLGEFLDPMLQTENWDKMEQVYRHAVTLVEKKQRSGDGFGSYDSAWNAHGEILYDLLDDNSGGGIERIAFFERVVRKDINEGKIAITGGGMRFGTHLFNAVKGKRDHANLVTALNEVFGELWELCGRESTPQLGLSCREFITRLNQSEMVQAINWANSMAESDIEWSAFAGELSNAWKLQLAISNQPGFTSQLKKIGHPHSWQQHYLNVITDDTTSVAWRMPFAGKMCETPHTAIKPDTLYACADVLTEALSSDAPFNGWQYVYITKSFNQLAVDDRWRTAANALHEGWVAKNANNHHSSGSGKAWKPWSAPVFLSLQMHCKLGDPDKLKTYLSEKNAASRLAGQPRTLFALVEAGFFEQALAALRKDTEKADHVTGYPTARNEYNAFYNPQLHDRLPEFLEQVDDAALRYYAELILLGAPDPPRDKRDPDATYKERFGRYTDVAKRFRDVDFDDNQVIREAALRQLANVEHCGKILEKEIKEEFDSIDLGSLCDSQDYTKIRLATRMVAAHASNLLRKNDLGPVQQYLTETIKADKVRYYYRRESLETFSVHLAKSIKNRSHHMKPDEIRGHLDAFHLLLTEPDDNIISYNELKSLIISYIAGEVILQTMENPPSKLPSYDISKKRNSYLARSLYSGNKKNFWVQFRNAYNFNVPNPKFRPDDNERHRRIEATLQHPMIIEALKKEQDIWKMMQQNQWVTAEERNSEWGKNLLTKWNQLTQE